MRFRDIPQFTRNAGYAVDIPWDYIERWLDNHNDIGQLDLDPPFQRAHVWNDAQRIRYVEFVLRGGHSSRDIYWNQKDYQHASFQYPMYLVDGKQRLEAVRRFMRDDLAVLGGVTYSGFTDRLPLDMRFKFHVNDLPTYADVLQWYIDLNAGGVAHTEDEIAKVRALLIEEK